MPSPPKKGFSEEKSFGKRTLDCAKYVGSHLPLLNEFNLFRNAVRKDDIPWNILVRLVLSGLYFGSAIHSYNSSSLNPRDWDRYYKIEEEKQKAKQKYQNQINSSYNSLFKNAENFEDSLEIYKKYGLPIKLQPVSFEEKEKIVNQNSLEGKTFGKEIKISAE